ncbi:hypothetical protein [Campylobacter sp.]|nr:hypothetical protein [Campylobacter sp.]
MCAIILAETNIGNGKKCLTYICYSFLPTCAAAGSLYFGKPK